MGDVMVLTKLWLFCFRRLILIRSLTHECGWWVLLVHWGFSDSRALSLFQAISAADRFSRVVFLL
jgi:hypothetical protein